MLVGWHELYEKVGMIWPIYRINSYKFVKEKEEEEGWGGSNGGGWRGGGQWWQ